MVKRTERSEQEWREILTDEEFQVCRAHGTERPFTGAYCDTKADGNLPM